MTWEFKNDEETYVLTGIDSDVELVASSCRGSPVVSIDDPETVVGVVACSSNGDLELFFLEANFLREIEGRDVLSWSPFAISCKVFSDSEIYGLNFLVPFDLNPIRPTQYVLAWLVAKVH